MKEIIFVLIAFLISLSSCSTISRESSKLSPLKPSEDYTNSLEAEEDDPEQFVVFWKYDDEEIHFELHCKTKGWVGLGFSPNGGMKGADLAIGWVDNSGKGHLQDCYSTDNARPMIDAHQDLLLIDSAKVDDYTIIKYKRKLATCDKDDREVKPGTYYLIFAWNNETPKTGERDWMYHGENRITRTTILLNYKEQNIQEQETLPTEYFTHDIKMPNITIAAQETYYFCEIFELPSFTEDVHLIQYEMIFGPQSKKFVHHLIGFECVEDFVPPGPLRRECGAVPIPGEFATNCMSRMSFAWGIGGKKEYRFPPQAGYLIKPSVKPRYMLLEMHYDNPRSLSGVVDDTGVRLFFTKQLRKYDLGILNLGTGILQIPPRSEATKFSSVCYPECTEKFFPEEGITLVTGLLHTHLAGKSVKTTLVRDGKEIKDIFNNPTYDFEYQNAMDIEPLKVMRGDALITECVYGTRNRTKLTTFGFGTYEEMCINFVYYYPRLPKLAVCQSQMPTQVLMNFYRSLVKDGLVNGLQISDNDDDYWQNAEYIDNYLKNNVTFTPVLTKKFEDLFGSEKQNRSIYCGNFAYPDDQIYKQNVMDYTVTEHYVEPDKCADVAVATTPAPLVVTTRKDSGSGSNKLSSSITIAFTTIIYYLFKTF